MKELLKIATGKLNLPFTNCQIGIKNNEGELSTLILQNKFTITTADGEKVQELEFPTLEKSEI